jgi:spore coat polysaccharide biosynthesis protein SpsF
MVGCIIQARTSSTRLPQKVLKSLPFGSDTCVLQQVIRRVKKAEKVKEIVIATTLDPEDDAIVDVANKENVKWFKGSKDNVLERYYLAAKENNLQYIVRITSDCPCIDPKIIDMVIAEHFKQKSDYSSNSLRRTFAHGLDVECFSFASLEKAYFNATEVFEKEHVTPYIYRCHPNEFKINGIEAPEELYAPEIRITLDTREDYILLCAVYDFLYLENTPFEATDIVNLFKEKAWLKEINSSILQKKIFDNVEDEMKEAIKFLDLQGLERVSAILKDITYKK